MTIQMDSGKDITANFSLRMHSLTIEVNGAGYVTPSADTRSYIEGIVVNVTATPDAGYQFDGWTGDVADAKSASTTVTIDANKTVIANFRKSTLPPAALAGIIIVGLAVVGGVSWFAVSRRKARA